MEMKSYNRLRTTLAVMAAAFLCLTAYADDGIFLAKPEKAGSLAEIVGEKANEIDSLAVEGPLNEADFNTLWEMGYKGWLEYLDLSKAKPEGDRIPDNAFFHEEEQAEYGSYFKRGMMPLPYLNTVILPENLKEIGEHAFAYTRIKSIMFPESLQRIGIGSFYRCPALEGKITVPDGLKELHGHSFAECPRITEVEIPHSVKSIGAYCFDKCHNLRTVSFSEGLEGILFCAFRETSLETLVLPKSLSSITDGAFCDVTTLKSIYSLNPKAPYALSIYVNGGPAKKTTTSEKPKRFGQDHIYSFSGTPTDIPVYIPVGSFSNYFALGWARFTNLIECEDLPELPHSGIEEMSAYEENIADASISVRNGRLIIESGADLGFTVHTPDGTRIASGKTKAGTASIVLPEGVYLVRAGKTASKVLI